MKKRNIALMIALGALMFSGLMSTNKKFFKMEADRFIKKKSLTRKGMPLSWQELSDIIKENMQELGISVPFEKLVPDELLENVVPHLLIDSQGKQEEIKTDFYEKDTEE